MQVLTTMTSKGQILIPQELRKRYGLRLNTKVYLEASDDGVKVKPTIDILDLAGSFKPKKNRNRDIMEARSAMEKTYKRF